MKMVVGILFAKSNSNEVNIGGAHHARHKQFS